MCQIARLTHRLSDYAKCFFSFPTTFTLNYFKLIALVRAGESCNLPFSNLTSSDNCVICNEWNSNPGDYILDVRDVTEWRAPKLICLFIGPPHPTEIGWPTALEKHDGISIIHVERGVLDILEEQTWEGQIGRSPALQLSL